MNTKSKVLINKEQWKNIPGYVGLYQSSNLGEIKSCYKYKGTMERILKPRRTRNGHLLVGLNKNRIKKMFFVHRLVLTTFVGPCPSGMECRHLDGNPQNNRLNNLKWGTRSENCQDAIKHGTNKNPIHHGSEHPMAKLNDKQIRIIKRLLKENKLTQAEIARIFDVTRQTIWAIKNKKTWSHIE